MPEVELRNRHREVVAVAMVDDDDFDRVTEHPWSLHPAGYAVGHAHFGSARTIGMHAFIMDHWGAGKGGTSVDHINGDRLDNRRENLRIVSNSANQQNQRRVTGVSFDRTRGRWRAYGKVNQKQTNLGYHDTREEAIAARRKWEQQHLPYRPELVHA